MVIHSYDVKNIRFHNENILVEDDAKIKNQEVFTNFSQFF